jgi:hypothetical protein
MNLHSMLLFVQLTLKHTKRTLLFVALVLQLLPLLMVYLFLGLVSCLWTLSGQSAGQVNSVPQVQQRFFKMANTILSILCAME